MFVGLVLIITTFQQIEYTMANSTDKGMWKQREKLSTNFLG